MSCLFLPKMDPERIALLRAANMTCMDFSLGDLEGVLIEEAQLPEVMNLVNVRALTQSDSGYEGIKTLDVEYGKLLPKLTDDHVATVIPDLPGIWPGVSRPAQGLVALLQRDVVLHYPRRTASPIDDGRFHVHIYSSPAGHTHAPPPERIWGVPVECLDLAWRGSSHGISLRDETTGYEVAELIGQNNLYVHHDLLKHRGTIYEEEILRKLLERVIVHLEIPAARLRLYKRNLFIDESSAATARVMNSVAATNDHAEKVKALRSEIAKRTREALQIEQNLLRNDSFSPEVFAGEYESLVALPQVTEVQVASEHIIVYTVVLNCRDDRTNRQHEIGAFRIMLPINGSAPLWFNMTRLVSGWKAAQQAPHVWNDGSACLGNTEDLFKALLGQRQYALAAQLAIEFVESANTADAAGKLVTNWPLVNSVQDQSTAVSPTATTSEAYSQNRQRYIDACASRVDDLVQQARERVTAYRSSLERLQSELVYHSRAASFRHRQTTNKLAVDRDELARQFDQLLAVAKVEDVDIREGKLLIRTETLVARDQGSGKCHQIGTFLIQIDLSGQGDCVHWTNLNSVINACRAQQQAPNVWASGRACLTDNHSVFVELIAKMQIATVARLAIQFIEQVDTRALPGQYLNSWPELPATKEGDDVANIL